MTIDEFITKWKVAQGREDSNSKPFLNDLCHALDLPTPGPWTGDILTSGYIFEAPINVINPDKSQSTKKIDLYKRNCFILEAKQATSDASATETLELFTRQTISAANTPKQNTSRIIRGRTVWRKYIDCPNLF